MGSLSLPLYLVLQGQGQRSKMMLLYFLSTLILAYNYVTRSVRQSQSLFSKERKLMLQTFCGRLWRAHVDSAIGGIT